MNNLTNEIKTSLLYYFIFARGMYAVTEIGTFYGRADVLAFPRINKQTDIIEVEVKISKDDLKKDFIKKQKKHNALNNKAANNYISKFYFAVPFDLVDLCNELLKINKLFNYGIIAYSETGFFMKDGNIQKSISIKTELSKRVRIIKKAKKLNVLNPLKTYMDNLNQNVLNRLIYEQCRFYKRCFIKNMPGRQRSKW